MGLKITLKPGERDDYRLGPSSPTAVKNVISLLRTKSPFSEIKTS